MANRWGNNGNSERLFLRASKSLQMVTVAMKLKDACSLEEEAEKAGFQLSLQKAKIMAPVRLFHGKQWEKEWKQ